MYQGQVDVISNRETWISDFIQLQEDDGSIVNILNPDVGFDVSVFVKDESGCTRIMGTIASGQIIIADSDVPNEPGFQWVIQLNGELCAGTYKFGVKTVSNGETKDLMLGTVAILEGN